MVEKLRAVSGSMFSGKTDELIRLVGRAEYADKSVLVFKPIVDDRWGKKNVIRSHSGAEHEATSVRNSREILKYIEEETEVVVIDEAQFFDDEIIAVVDELLDRDIEVIVAGLPLDFRGEPFGEMPILLAKSDSITRLTAVCTHPVNGKNCGEEATRTQRIIDGKPADYHEQVIEVGAGEKYAPRCLDHHVVPGKPERNLS